MYEKSIHGTLTGKIFEYWKCGFPKGHKENCNHFSEVKKNVPKNRIFIFRENNRNLLQGCTTAELKRQSLDLKMLLSSEKIDDEFLFDAHFFFNFGRLLKIQFSF